MLSCEVTRVLKLCDDGVQPVSVTIPRRDKMRFHEELFPPAPGKLHLPLLVGLLLLVVVDLHHPIVVQGVECDLLVVSFMLYVYPSGSFG